MSQPSPASRPKVVGKNADGEVQEEVEERKEAVPIRAKLNPGSCCCEYKSKKLWRVLSPTSWGQADAALCNALHWAWE